MGFETGQRVGGYDILEPLGNARIGLAYRVKNTLGERIEMLRILPRELQEDKEQVNRFLREIKVHARLSHPNIVSFYNAAEIDGQLVMTTEMVEGKTLDRILEEGRPPLMESVRYMIAVLSALAYAHEHDVIHREVSPANIVVTPEGHVKLSGFGMAKSTQDPQLTQVGTVMGWLEYMSPEQVQGGAVDLHADIYSCGAVLFEMVTGQVPFVCNTHFELMLAHVKTPPKPPIEINPEIPSELSSIVLTALEKDPARRFHSAGAFRNALSSVVPLLERPQPSAHTRKDDTQEVPLAAPVPPPASALWKNPLVLVGAAVITFLFVLFLMIRLLQFLQG
jgi:serine/threonine-protein kinase